MVTVEFPKEPRTPIKYAELKKCLFKRESGEITPECQQKFKDWRVED